MSPEWRYSATSSDYSKKRNVEAWWFPGSDVAARYNGYVLEASKGRWWISPDSWGFKQDRVGPYETPEDALTALDTLLLLNEAPKLEKL